MKEKIAHQNYRDSTLRRLAYNISGKKADFTSNLAREEHLYLRTSQRYKDAVRSVADVETKLAEAEKTKAGIEAMGKRRKAALQARDKLYELIFAGPTPEFPDEDRVELAVAETIHSLGELQTKFENEMQALEILGEASVILRKTLNAIFNAERASAESQERTRTNFIRERRIVLSMAKATVAQLEVLIRQAKALSSEVGSMGPIEIPPENCQISISLSTKHIWLEFQRVIEQTRIQVAEENRRLREDMGKSRSRIDKLERQIKNARQELIDGKQRLRQVRQGIFSSVMSELPAY